MMRRSQLDPVYAYYNYRENAEEEDKCEICTSDCLSITNIPQMMFYCDSVFRLWWTYLAWEIVVDTVPLGICLHNNVI